MAPRRLRTLVWLVAALGSAAPAGQTVREGVSAPAPDGSLVIESPRPLNEATSILADRYGIPIAYEEPKWLSNEDLKIGTMIVGDLPKFILPGGLYPDQTPTAEAAARRMVEAYNRQNNVGIRFRVQQSRWGLHVVPSQIHAADGHLVPATSVLDVPVTVSAAERMASEHLKAICEAVSRVSGIRLGRGSPYGQLDPLFAANGVIAPGDASWLSPEERKVFSFLWGSSETIAREALANLLQQSATTFRWAMLCDPPAAGEPRFCTVNLATLKKRVTTADGKLRPGTEPLIFDRAAKPPMPAPPRQAPAPANEVR